MIDPINPVEPMFQIVFNSSFISYLILSVGILLLLTILSTPIIFVKKLPEHIYKRLEKKLEKETELLKIMLSQVEPKKIETYLSIIDSYSDIVSPQCVNKNLNSSEKETEIQAYGKNFKLLSRLYFFASDKTIEAFLSFKKNALPSQSLELYANFVSSMRCDLHQDTKMKSKDFIDVLLTWKNTKEPDS